MATVQAKGAWGKGWWTDLERLLILPPANQFWNIDFMQTIGLAVWTLLTGAILVSFVPLYNAQNLATENASTTKLAALVLSLGSPPIDQRELWQTILGLFGPCDTSLDSLAYLPGLL